MYSTVPVTFWIFQPIDCQRFYDIQKWYNPLRRSTHPFVQKDSNDCAIWFNRYDNETVRVTINLQVPFSALFSDPAWQMHCNQGPPFSSILSDQMHQLLIFFSRPWPFAVIRINFLFAFILKCILIIKYLLCIKRITLYNNQMKHTRVFIGSPNNRTKKGCKPLSRFELSWLLERMKDLDLKRRG